MIIGIDLGTTNSLVSVWRDGKVVLIPNSLATNLTPSCVSIDEDGSILVGHAAKERLQTHPDRTTASFKRYMGSNRTVKLGKVEFRAEELSALVLKSLKADAEAWLGVAVTDAIITVPAYFSDAQRKATRAAGQLAGFNVEGLLNEPTAAALTYGIHQLGAETRFLVFDLGGGTFDVSILEMFEGVMEVRATAGDNLLGGDDFTDCLVELFFERKSAPLSLRKDAIFVQRLRAQVEQAKCKLSSSPQASISVRHGKDIYSMDVDESAFEKACASLLKQLRVPVERALRDANLRAAQLNNVVLAGGATRMPMIRRLVTTMFGRFPALDFNPDEVVAMGAAVQGGLAVRDSALSEVVMTDVAPYSLGVAVVKRLSPTVVSGGHFDPIVERNSTVPISRVKTYFPTQDNQMELRLEIYQGEARMVRDNVLLGTLQLSLPEGKAGQEGVDVRFTYDVNGLLEVETLMLSTQEKTRMLIEGNPGLLSESEIATRLAGLNQLKIHPRDQLENRTLMARAERLYQQLHGDIREWLGSHITELEYALTTQEPRTISGIKQRLEELLAHIERDSYI